MRLFIGLELGAEVHHALERTLDQVRPTAPDAKWVPPANAHLTLVFLGNVDEAKRAPVEKALSAAAKQHPPFDLRVRQGGSFGTRSHPRVLWIGVEGDTAALGALQADVAKAMASLGFELEDRPYAAHLTLARARDPRGDRKLASSVEALAGVDLGAARIEHVVLFQSHTSSKGATYEALLKAPLEG